MTSSQLLESGQQLLRVWEQMNFFGINLQATKVFCETESKFKEWWLTGSLNLTQREYY